MDRLVNYIAFRKKTYGNIEEYPAATSMYYMMGPYKVRISDHMKYGESSANECDYYFIIQPDGNYIFINGPKYNKDSKMYMKVISYAEAKDFIKSLHDFAIRYSKMTDWFKPEDWNRDPAQKCTSKLPWEKFKNKYLLTADEKRKISIVSKIENLIYGCVQKGNVNTKILNFSPVYDQLNDSQYKALMEKMGEA